MTPEDRLRELGLALPTLSAPRGHYVRARRYGAARLAGLALLATIAAELGELSRVTAVLRVFGMVNGAPGFVATPSVIDGCSDLLLAVFGTDVGRHVRSAIGVAELPFDLPVEIEAVVAVA